MHTFAQIHALWDAATAFDNYFASFLQCGCTPA